MYKRLVTLCIIINMHSYICSMDEKASDTNQEPYAQSYWDTDYFKKKSPNAGIVSFFRSCQGRSTGEHNPDLYALYGAATLVHPYAKRCPSGFVKKDNFKSKTVTNLRLKIECACSCAIKGVRADVVTELVNNYFKLDNPWYEQWRDHKGRTLSILALEKAYKYQDHSQDRWSIVALLMHKAPCAPQDLLLLCNKIINTTSEHDPKVAEEFLSQLRSIENALPIINDMSYLPLIYCTPESKAAPLEPLLNQCKESAQDHEMSSCNRTFVYLKTKKNKTDQHVQGKVHVRFGCPLKDAVRNGNLAKVQECVTNDDYAHWFDHDGKPLEIYAFKKAQKAPSLEAQNRAEIARLIAERSTYSPANWCSYITSLIKKRRFSDIATYCKAARKYGQLKLQPDAPLIAYMFIKCDKKQVLEEFRNTAQSSSPSGFMNALTELITCDASIEAPCLYRKNKWLTPKQIAKKRGLSPLVSVAYDTGLDHTCCTTSEDNSAAK